MRPRGRSVKQLMVHLPPAQIAAVDDLARSRGLSRSRMLAELLAVALPLAERDELAKLKAELVALRPEAAGAERHG